MSYPVISVENLSKSYRLGQIGTGTLTNDLKVWAARVRGKPNPLLRIGQTDHSNRTGEILWALKDVSFQVEQGEVLGIIGRNGAGKSTLLKILSRVTAPTSGCVKVKGRIASLLEVGTGFHPELTGRENIYLNGAILGMTKEEVRRRFDEIVSFAEIEKFIDTPVKRYSSGMYVRLAFAVAAHLESEILLVDEVLAVGDFEFQKKCLSKMGDVAQEGRTVVFISHNLGAVRQLCKKGLLIENGKVISQNSISEVIGLYINTFSPNRSQLVGNEELPIIQELSSKHVKSIGLLNSSEESSNTFFMGEDIILKLDLVEMNSIPGIRIGVSFNTLDGQRIFIFDTKMKSNLNEKQFSKHDIGYLRINNLPLIPGSYTLDIIIAENIGVRREILKDIVSFTVLPANIYHNSYLLTDAYGFVYHLDGFWQIENV